MSGCKILFLPWSRGDICLLVDIALICLRHLNLQFICNVSIHAFVYVWCNVGTKYILFSVLYSLLSPTYWQIFSFPASLQWYLCDTSSVYVCMICFGHLICFIDPFVHPGANTMQLSWAYLYINLPVFLLLSSSLFWLFLVRGISTKILESPCWLWAEIDPERGALS